MARSFRKTKDPYSDDYSLENKQSIARMRKQEKLRLGRLSIPSEQTDDIQELVYGHEAEAHLTSLLKENSYRPY